MACRTPGFPRRAATNRGVFGLARRQLGDFDLYPKLDLAEHGIETGVARDILQVGGSRFELGERRRREAAPEQPDLQLIQRVQRVATPFDGMPAPLRWVLDALEGD